jgi:signal transduction histidine kinase
VGDPIRITQVLLNLTGNAIKFTERGRITVQSFLESRSESELTVRFEVSDTGIGIAGDDQDKLFDPFTQVDNSTTRSYGGTGLGLAISSQLVKLMGGKIGVVSELGKGSTFWFTLPLKRLPLPKNMLKNPWRTSIYLYPSNAPPNQAAGCCWWKMTRFAARWPVFN